MHRDAVLNVAISVLASAATELIFPANRPYADTYSRRHMADPAWPVFRVTQPSFGLSKLQKSSNQHGIHAEGDSHEKQITSNDAGGSD
jgi:hypothetical protein